MSRTSNLEFVRDPNLYPQDPRNPFRNLRSPSVAPFAVFSLDRLAFGRRIVGLSSDDPLDPQNPHPTLRTAQEPRITPRDPRTQTKRPPDLLQPSDHHRTTPNGPAAAKKPPRPS
ncbi:hypothetical protein PGTUg99_029497 [Puccinia graminis f. sp. tritici]|uniref:Uncharacterized protein n=1 Tax=Puccinia graminis f. sp. tritici TaxID=56615 RepID=A0A5B0RH08_PUCGR|nr:hypothetical protein PGTUg99_029497 [Puccinia graminis f. sp. tritici]